MATKDKDIRCAVGQLNSIIKDNGIAVVYCKRYGYKAFDLYHLSGGCIDTLESGLTSGQAFEYIWTLIKGIQLATSSIYRHFEKGGK